jgi:excinuclease UvrABC nuclease subunit
MCREQKTAISDILLNETVSFVSRIERQQSAKFPIQEASRLPSRTGVYLFSDQHGNIMYVGKARDLRRRVAQHIRQGGSPVSERATGTRRERLLMAATRAVTWMPADSELEALLLEDSLIKAHRPSYNRRQNKFTKQAYLEVDCNLHTVRVTDHCGTSQSYGPFSDIFYAQRLAAILDERFGLSPLYGGGLRGKPPSAAAAERFLLGYDDGLIRSLQEEIERMALDLQFERAATLRDQLFFCERFLRRQAFVRLFTFGALVLSEVRPPRESEHYLFERGRLVDRVSSAIPEEWQSCPSRTDLGPSEPRWLLFERALVVSAWLSVDASRKSVRVLREDRS